MIRWLYFNGVRIRFLLSIPDPNARHRPQLIDLQIMLRSKGSRGGQFINVRACRIFDTNNKTRLTYMDNVTPAPIVRHGSRSLIDIFGINLNGKGLCSSNIQFNFKRSDFIF